MTNTDHAVPSDADADAGHAAAGEADDADFGGPSHEGEPILNEMAFEYLEEALSEIHALNVDFVRVGETRATVLDFGVRATGGLGAGMALIEVSTCGLVEAEVQMLDFDGSRWPHLLVMTDQPFEACLLSQYAGWKLTTDNFFAIASGPMRTARGKEELLQITGYREKASRVAGVLETGQLPDEEVINLIASQCGVLPSEVGLCVAPTASIAGGMQVVSRSVETALHKLFELGFDLGQIVSAAGTAPIPPVAEHDLAAIGRTNDAILYGGSVTLWVDADDEEIAEVGADVPSSASPASGRPFIDLFEEVGRDFYKVDPMLFSPAEVVFHSLRSGRVQRFGRRDEKVLLDSFDMR